MQDSELLRADNCMLLAQMRTKLDEFMLESEHTADGGLSHAGHMPERFQVREDQQVVATTPQSAIRDSDALT